MKRARYVTVLDRKLVETNAARTPFEPEYEIIDTGVFNEGRYWDIEVEYAKAGPEEIYIRITAHNRGPEPALQPTSRARRKSKTRTESSARLAAERQSR